MRSSAVPPRTHAARRATSAAQTLPLLRCEIPPPQSPAMSRAPGHNHPRTSPTRAAISLAPYATPSLAPPLHAPNTTTALPASTPYATRAEHVPAPAPNTAPTSTPQNQNSPPALRQTLPESNSCPAAHQFSPPNTGSAHIPSTPHLPRNNRNSAPPPGQSRVPSPLPVPTETSSCLLPAAHETASPPPKS